MTSSLSLMGSSTMLSHCILLFGNTEVDTSVLLVAVINCQPLHAAVAPEWLSKFSLDERVDVFHIFFAQAPAAILLPTLVTCAPP